LSIFGDDYPTEDGTCIRDYIHVVDLAKAHVDALKWMSSADENQCEVFNIGTGKGSSVQNLVDTFERVNGIKINKKVVARRPGDITAIYANADKAKEVLGWSAKLTMEDALRDAWNWQQYLANNW
jgi:UDP-glucose 4-epimerase